MKIILATGIYPPESGGPATYTHGLASALRTKGYQADVIAYGEAGSEEGVTRVSRRGGAVVRYLRYAWKVFRAARKADLVYAQGPVSEGLPATIGARLAGRPLVMKVVGDYAWEMSQNKQIDTSLLEDFLKRKHSGSIGWYERIERWTARQARNVIVPSQYLASVVGRWGVMPEKIEVVLNAAEPLPVTKGRLEERRDLGVTEKVVLFTAVRAVSWKGVGELIEWWNELPSTHILVVAGDGPELVKWKSLARQKKLEDKIKFLGRVDRGSVARWIEAADAFVLNSGYEGYPHVLAEAASRGLPCIVSDQGGNPETKNQFGELITVLGYNQKHAWLEVLKQIKKRDQANNPVLVWKYEHMLEATLKVLANQSDSVRVIMLGYEVGIFNQNDTMRRISNLASKIISVDALVLSRLEKGEVMLNQNLRAFGWPGSIVKRVYKIISTGIRLAKRPNTVISAQDPFAAGLMGYIISRWSNRPLEIQEHGDFFSGVWGCESWKNRLWTCVGGAILKRAERVRAVSERVKSHLVANGIPAEKIDVIPVSQNLDNLLIRPLADFGTPVRLISPCRFVPQKGLDLLLKSAKALMEKGIDFNLKLIGKGPLENILRQQIKKLGLSERVFIEPWRDQKELWDEADIFIMSSRYEGWGRTIVEAMAAGVAIVTTEVGCVGSFFRPQIDGRVVQPDPDSLAAAIIEQINEKDRRDAMRASARSRAAQFSDRDKLHDLQRAGWRSILNRKELGPRWELWVAGLILFIVLSRIASVVLFHNSLAQREWGFFYLVDHWLKGYGYSYATELGCASAYRSPGYLFFLTALYSFFAPTNTWAQAIIQNIFVVGVLWLVYAVGKRLVGKRAAFVGALLMTAYPYTFYHYTQYYHTFLSSFFLLLLVWCLLKFVDTKKITYAIEAGLTIGFLAYVQGTILPATPFIVAWLLYRLWPDWKLVLKAAVIMAVLSAGLIAPWTYRNWKQLHVFVPLTTDLGHALFKANNEVIYELTARGYPQEIVDEITVSSTDPNYKQYRLPPDLEQTFKQDGVFRDSIYWTEWHPKEPNGNVATCADLGIMTEVEFDRYWKGKATHWLKENWWTEGLKLQLLKLKTFFQPSLFPSVKTGAEWSFAGSPLKVFLARGAVTLASAVVVFGGLLGMFFMVRRRNKNVWLPIAIIIVYSVMHTFFAGYTKYRIPLDNLMAVYAGWVIVRGWDRLRGRKDADV